MELKSGELNSHGDHNGEMEDMLGSTLFQTLTLMELATLIKRLFRLWPIIFDPLIKPLF